MFKTKIHTYCTFKKLQHFFPTVIFVLWSHRDPFHLNKSSEITPCNKIQVKPSSKFKRRKEPPLPLWTSLPYTMFVFYCDISILTIMEMMNDMADSKKRWCNFQLPGNLPAASSHLI